MKTTSDSVGTAYMLPRRHGKRDALMQSAQMGGQRSWANSKRSCREVEGDESGKPPSSSKNQQHQLLTAGSTLGNHYKQRLLRLLEVTPWLLCHKGNHIRISGNLKLFLIHKKW